ncbi:MAG: amidotransferase [Blastocatellia bacterium]|nr:amidotransferase [Blastocatellia bacterium]
MKLGLLECDHVADRFRAIAGDYRDMFPALFARHAPAVSFRNYDACNGELPASIDACDGYLCTGSRFSVYQELDWILELKGFVRRLAENDRPFIGICFGHQMLAEALGSRVAPAVTGWGVGVHPMEVVTREPWMQPATASIRLQYMHQDQVAYLPERGVPLGRTDHCPIAMFRVGASMLGIQAHPEFPAPYAEALLRDRRERIGNDRVEAALDGLGAPTDEAVVVSWIAHFLG